MRVIFSLYDKPTEILSILYQHFYLFLFFLFSWLPCKKPEVFQESNCILDAHLSYIQALVVVQYASKELHHDTDEMRLKTSNEDTFAIVSCCLVLWLIQCPLVVIFGDFDS